MQDIKELIYHILRNSDRPYNGESEFFQINEHEVQYGSTKISAAPRGKEHKLWTPRKVNPYRCYLILQLINNNFLLTHVFPNTDLQQILEDKGYTNLVFEEPHTYAAQRRSGKKDQFRGTVKSGLDMVKVISIISIITDETVNRRLHRR